MPMHYTKPTRTPSRSCRPSGTSRHAPCTSRRPWGNRPGNLLPSRLARPCRLRKSGRPGRAALDLVVELVAFCTMGRRPASPARQATSPSADRPPRPAERPLKHAQTAPSEAPGALGVTELRKCTDLSGDPEYRAGFRLLEGPRGRRIGGVYRKNRALPEFRNSAGGGWAACPGRSVHFRGFVTVRAAERRAGRVRAPYLSRAAPAWPRGPRLPADPNACSDQSVDGFPVWSVLDTTRPS